MRVVGTNVFGAFATIQAFYPLLKVPLLGLAACTDDLHKLQNSICGDHPCLQQTTSTNADANFRHLCAGAS